MTQKTKFKVGFIERFFFWCSMLLVGASLYLFVVAHQNTETLRELRMIHPDGSITYQNLKIVTEHDFTSKTTTKLTGIAQYPKGSASGQMS